MLYGASGSFPVIKVRRKERVDGWVGDGNVFTLLALCVNRAHKFQCKGPRTEVKATRGAEGASVKTYNLSRRTEREARGLWKNWAEAVGGPWQFQV